MIFQDSSILPILPISAFTTYSMNYLFGYFTDDFNLIFLLDRT